VPEQNNLLDRRFATSAKPSLCPEVAENTLFIFSHGICFFALGIRETNFEVAG